MMESCTVTHKRSVRDGGGICSPGRWHPSERRLHPQAGWFTDLLDKSLGSTDQDSLVIRIILGKVSEQPLQMIAYEA